MNIYGREHQPCTGSIERGNNLQNELLGLVTNQTKPEVQTPSTEEVKAGGL